MREAEALCSPHDEAFDLGHGSHAHVPLLRPIELRRDLLDELLELLIAGDPGLRGVDEAIVSEGGCELSRLVLGLRR